MSYVPCPYKLRLNIADCVDFTESILQVVNTPLPLLKSKVHTVDFSCVLRGLHGNYCGITTGCCAHKFSGLAC